MGGGTLLSGEPELGSLVGQSFMDLEKDLVEAFEKLVQKDYPNPECVGCPGPEVLAQFARRPSDTRLSHALTHLERCAPCFHELKELRKGRG